MPVYFQSYCYLPNSVQLSSLSPIYFFSVSPFHLFLSIYFWFCLSTGSRAPETSIKNFIFCTLRCCRAQLDILTFLRYDGIVFECFIELGCGAKVFKFFMRVPASVLLLCAVFLKHSKWKVIVASVLILIVSRS